MATIVESDLVEVKVTGYELQRQTWENGKPVWRTCYVTTGYPTPDAYSIPCEYDYVTEARARLAKFREDNPATPYRMLRYVTITEEVE